MCVEISYRFNYVKTFKRFLEKLRIYKNIKYWSGISFEAYDAYKHRESHLIIVVLFLTACAVVLSASRNVTLACLAVGLVLITLCQTFTTFVLLGNAYNQYYLIFSLIASGLGLKQIFSFYANNSKPPEKALPVIYLLFESLENFSSNFYCLMFNPIVVPLVYTYFISFNFVRR